MMGSNDEVGVSCLTPGLLCFALFCFGFGSVFPIPVGIPLLPFHLTKNQFQMLRRYSSTRTRIEDRYSLNI